MPRRLLPVLAAVFLSTTAAHAQAWRAYKNFGSPDLDPDKALRGGVSTVQVDVADADTISLSLESCFTVPVPPERVIASMKKLNGNGEGAGTLAVGRQRAISNPASTEDFDGIPLAEGSWLAEQAPNAASGTLNLSREEAEALKAAGKGGAAEAWKTIFARRSQLFQTKGLVGSPAYEAGDTFKAHPAMVSLLKSHPKILATFKTLLGGPMAAQKGEGFSDPFFYWENSSIQGNQTVSLSGIFTREMGNGEYQTAEATYYVTSQYYASLILTCLWPAQVKGQSGTFVWRGDYVFTGSLRSRKGIERMAAEKIMLLETQNVIRDFQQKCR